MSDAIHEINQRLLATLDENEALREWIAEATSEAAALRKRVAELIAERKGRVSHEYLMARIDALRGLSSIREMHTRATSKGGYIGYLFDHIIWPTLVADPNYRHDEGPGEVTPLPSPQKTRPRRGGVPAGVSTPDREESELESGSTSEET